MRTIEIPRSSWANFLNELSRKAGGQAVRLEAENSQWGDQEMEEALPLHEIILETKGSAGGEIEITVGGRTEELSHRIERPKRLYARLNDMQQIECLDIEDGDGGKTLLYFEVLPPLPEYRREESGHAPAP